MGPTIVDAPPINVATIIVKTKLISNNARGAIEPKSVSYTHLTLPTNREV